MAKVHPGRKKEIKAKAPWRRARLPLSQLDAHIQPQEPAHWKKEIASLNGSPDSAIIKLETNQIERRESHGQDMEYLVLAN
ncbi:hypothetical protein [Clostridium transplantifaecale]|uniref:hypothetical protein n=1 Tax=Clostridium transplantifaecale TaxID=2479838 RepID=UPI000F632A05|nr:hypothetical protein [Clostridium transplantifaecale]